MLPPNSGISFGKLSKEPVYKIIEAVVQVVPPPEPAPPYSS